MTSVAEVLREARSLVDTPEKWCKGTYGDGEGRHCISGTLRDVGAEEAYTFLQRTIHTAGPLSSWNDAPERTHADVLAAFDKAIALAEAEEASCTT